MPIIDAVRLPLTLAVAADVSLVLPLAAFLVIERRLRRLPVVPWRAVLAVSSLGFLLGSGVLMSDGVPIVRTTLILVIVILGAALVIRGRVRDAGAMIVASGAPWLVYAGAATADLALGAPVDGFRLLAPLLLAGATVVFGAWLIAIHRPTPVDEPPSAPATSAARRWDALARAVFRTGDWATPPVIAGALALIGTAWLVALVTHGGSIWVAWLGFVVGSVVGAVLSGLGTVFARSGNSRRALEAFAWLAEGDYVRLSALAGRTVTPTMGSVRRFVREIPEQPDNRWIRVEALVADGERVKARELAERMPETTAFERLEREADLAWLDWIDGRDDDTRLRAAAASVDPADAVLRARAAVVLACHAARVRLATGSRDPLEPLRDARTVLGARADRAILRVSARLARGILPVSALLEGVVLLLDRVGGT